MYSVLVLLCEAALVGVLLTLALIWAYASTDRHSSEELQKPEGVTPELSLSPKKPRTPVVSHPYVCQHVQLTAVETHRCFLMFLSQKLGDKEVDRLKYTCDIPESRWPEIKEAFHVFKCLEEVNKLNPHNYEYLAHMLGIIGRLDLASQLHTEHLIDSLDCRNHWINNYWTEQRHVYIQGRTKLTKFASDRGEPILKRTLKDLVDQLVLAWDMKEPVYSWRVDCNCLDESVSHSLEVLSPFILAKLQMYPLPAFNKMREPQEMCDKYFREFNEVANRLEWNREIRDLCMNRKCPHVEPASAVCTYIKDVCYLVLHDHANHKKIEIATKYSSILEAHFRSGWQMLVVIMWLRSLCLLHVADKLDLRKYVNQLTDIVSKHRDNINRVYHLIGPIVGEEVMQKVAPLLEPPTDAEPESSPSIWEIKAVAWYVLILELLGHAMGCSIDPMEVAKRYRDRFQREFESTVIDHYVTSKMAIQRIEHEVIEGVETLLESHQVSSEYLHLLLPE